MNTSVRTVSGYKCKTESPGMTERISKNLKLDKVRIELILN